LDFHNWTLFQSIGSVAKSFSAFKANETEMIEYEMPMVLQAKNRPVEAIIFAYEKLMDRMLEALEVDINRYQGKKLGIKRHNAIEELKKGLRQELNTGEQWKEIDRRLPELHHGKNLSRFWKLNTLRNNIAHGSYDDKTDVQTLFGKESIEKHLLFFKEMFRLFIQARNRQSRTRPVKKSD
jgi:hypothetical protein